LPVTEERATWHVVETKRHKERAARARLEHYGIASYLPLLRVWPRPAVGSDVTIMFPGYLFAWVSSRDFYRVSLTAGVRGFVNFGGAPARLDEAVVDFLREREGPDGIIGGGGIPAGAEVVITDGPFRGLLGIIERRLSGRQRVMLLLDILQRQTRVEMPDQWIRPA
jgi:transcriptional antiterminator RfaH